MKPIISENTRKSIEQIKDYAPGYAESFISTVSGKTGLTMRQAIAELYSLHFGRCAFVMSLPEWGGFWFVDDDNCISVITTNEEYTQNPWFGEYQDRNDWNVIFRDLEIEQRIKNAKNGKHKEDKKEV